MDPETLVGTFKGRLTLNGKVLSRISVEIRRTDPYALHGKIRATGSLSCNHSFETTLSEDEISFETQNGRLHISWVLRQGAERLEGAYGAKRTGFIAWLFRRQWQSGHFTLHRIPHPTLSKVLAVAPPAIAIAGACLLAYLGVCIFNEPRTKYYTSETQSLGYELTPVRTDHAHARNELEKPVDRYPVINFEGGQSGLPTSTVAAEQAIVNATAQTENRDWTHSVGDWWNQNGDNVLKVAEFGWNTVQSLKQGGNPSHQWVNGNGGYWRTTPNASRQDNFSHQENVNPYTGKRGYTK